MSIGYAKRHRMSRLIMARGFTVHEAAALVACMIGKSHEEKEKIAGELIEKILSGEIRPTGDAQKGSSDY